MFHTHCFLVGVHGAIACISIDDGDLCDKACKLWAVTAGLEKGKEEVALPSFFLQYSKSAEELLGALNQVNNLSSYGESMRNVLKPIMDLKPKESLLAKQRSSLEPDEVKPLGYELTENGDKALVDELPSVDPLKPLGVDDENIIEAPDTELSKTHQAETSNDEVELFKMEEDVDQGPVMESDLSVLEGGY